MVWRVPQPCTTPSVRSARSERPAVYHTVRTFGRSASRMSFRLCKRPPAAHPSVRPCIRPSVRPPVQPSNQATAPDERQGKVTINWQKRKKFCVAQTSSHKQVRVGEFRY